ncbi:MAG TPA: hypothetical protein PKA27_00925 [Fimbriimonadaceae bacterium]|nr:hypothetical protein [Fimbriimonadaceae bacterium]
MNVAYLPWIAFGVAVLSIFATADPPQDDRKSGASLGSYAVLALVAALGVFGGMRFDTTLPGLSSAALGFGLGAVLAALCGGLGLTFMRTAGNVAPLGLAVAAVAGCGWLGEGAPLGLVFGAAAAAWLADFGMEDNPSPWAARAAGFAGAIVATNLLGGAWEGEWGKHAGTVVGICLVAAWIFGSFFGRKEPMRIGISTVLASVALYFAVTKILGFSGLAEVGIGALFIALVVGWMVPDDEDGGFRPALGTVIWVAAATSAFGAYRGLGMGVGLCVAFATLAMLGKRRATLTLGPVALLVFYRVFREMHTDASRAFDIGQHYAIIGLLLGTLVPLLALEWLRGPGKQALGRATAGGLWMLLFLSAPLVSAILLGPKGVIGYLVGLGLASLVDSLKGERSVHGLTLGLGLAALSALSYTWLEPYLDLTRQEKVTTLAYVGGGIAVLAGLIFLLSIPLKPKQKPS